RREATAFTPADAIDAEYGRLLREAVAGGVEAMAYGTLAEPDQVRIGASLVVQL
ncbi:MAG: DNA/RNA nuclease SfsA, partial [Desulfuromonadales bacterium]|nr:DNA/RNA nuclease SfsA [Desulfuromonadales bacterium]